MQPTTPTHPVEFDVDYPDRPLDRFSTLLRPLFAIPILVVLAVLGGPAQLARAAPASLPDDDAAWHQHVDAVTDTLLDLR